MSPALKAAAEGVQVAVVVWVTARVAAEKSLCRRCFRRSWTP